MGFITEKIEKKDEYRASLLYTYGEENDNATNDELLGKAAWRHLYSDRFYVGPRFEFRRDDIADIQYRTSLTGVLGYYLIKEEKISLTFEGGFGFSAEKQGGIANNYGHTYGGQFFEYNLNKKTKIYQTLSIIVPLNDTNDHQIGAEMGLETTLTDTLSLKIFAQNNYDARPAAGRDENDFKLITGISYKF
jgi:putative salt-induced outer membrane protein YdiY